MRIGNVKSIVLDRGFGFITTADGPDVFFHFRDLAHGPRFDESLVGECVAFEIVATDKGPRAENVRLAK